MEGQAQLFSEFESKANTWNMLKAELRREFDKQSNSLLVHQQMAERKKRRNESAIEYLYDMMIIGAQGNIDMEAILTHTTNGIPGHPQTKTILYEAKNIAEYKEKLMIYELQQKQTGETSSRTNNENRYKDRTNKPKIPNKRCNNCGDTKHQTNDCPRKKDGPKCFACTDEICPKKSKAKHKPNIAVIHTQGGATKDVTLNGQTVQSLIDTGSDINVIQQKTHQRLKLPRYVKCEYPFEGVGSRNKTLGYISLEITIDGESFRDIFYICQKF